MLNLNYKPKHLPQISAPYTYVLDQLKKENVGYQVMTVNPSELEPSQGIVFGNEVAEIDPFKAEPIWVSKDNKILDGHHRYASSLSKNLPIKAIKIMVEDKEGCRILNKIQDIYDYKQENDVDEVVGQDQINADNQKDSGVSSSEELSQLEAETKTDDRQVINSSLDELTTNKQMIVGYRNKPLNKKSEIGNFFIIEPKDGYEKYEIEFENLLDTSKLGISFDNKNPVESIAKIWFPNVNFEQLSKQHSTNENAITKENIINRAVAKKAKTMGFDGILYNNILQVLK
jgi:hypothetical protein